MKPCQHHWLPCSIDDYEQCHFCGSYKSRVTPDVQALYSGNYWSHEHETTEGGSRDTSSCAVRELHCVLRFFVRHRRRTSSEITGRSGRWGEAGSRVLPAVHWRC